MLDTVVLTIDSSHFMIKDHNKFTPSTIGLFEPPYYRIGKRANYPCYQNPTKTELEAGNYKPRLTVTKRMKDYGFCIKLRIEFSAPKLIKGNNFDELGELDFENVINTLLRKLDEMGVETNYFVLANAEVSAIHYSKNIPLTDYSTSSMIISELHKINLNKRLDLNKTDYRNEGQSIRYHGNTFELVFYDKIKDMQQGKMSEKRAFEKDYAGQLDLLQELKEIQPLEVIRMEARFGNRQKLKKVLKDLGIEQKLTFAWLYDPKLAQKVLLHYWQEMTDSLYLAMLAEAKPADLFEKIANAAGKKAKPSKVLQLMGLLIMIENAGVRQARAHIEAISCDRTWHRMKRELAELKLLESNKFKAINNIKASLEAFEPVRIRDFKELQK